MREQMHLDFQNVIDLSYVVDENSPRDITD